MKPRHLSLVIALCSTVFLPATQAALPGANDPKAYTIAQYQQDCNAYDRQTLAGMYREVGKKSPTWDASAIAALDGLANHFRSKPPLLGGLYRFPDAITAEKLLTLTTTAVERDRCEDPLVLYAHAVALLGTGKTDQALPVAQRAFDGLRDGAYPPYRVCGAAKRLAALKGHRGDPKAVYLETLIKLTATTKNEATPRRIFADYIDQEFAQAPLEYKNFYDNTKKLPGADPWLQDLIGGRSYILAAWEARGSGWAETVKAEQWKVFYENLAKARECLERAWKLDPRLPEPAVEMITVATGEGERSKESARVWLDRAIGAQFDYHAAYQRYLGATLPRWGGSYKAMEAFALECRDTRRYDTLVPWELCYALEVMTNDRGDFGCFNDLYQPFVEVISGYPAKDPERKLWAKTCRFGAAWRTGRLKEARQLLDAGGTELDPKVMPSFHAEPAMAVSEVYALTGASAQKLQHANDLVAQGQKQQAVAIFQEVKEKLAKDDRGAAYVQQRIEELSAAPPTGQPVQVVDDLAQAIVGAARTIKQAVDEPTATAAIPKLEAQAKLIAQLQQAMANQHIRRSSIPEAQADRFDIALFAYAMQLQRLSGNQKLAQILSPSLQKIRVAELEK